MNQTENQDSQSAIKFSDLNLSAPILKAVEENGYMIPSAIQAKAIPHIIAGRDVMAAAQTGTGKTAAFTLPVLERLKNGCRVNSNQTRALIITPTRELAAQIGESVLGTGTLFTSLLRKEMQKKVSNSGCVT